MPLADVTTFRLGGPCRDLVTCATPDALADAVRTCRGRSEMFLLIGGGSNLLVSDEGYEGTVLRFHSTQPLVQDQGPVWEVSGSTRLDDLARLAAEAGRDGVGCCHGIPGTVGGAVVGNAGAWGRQIGDELESVSVLERDGSIRAVTAEELGFAYRRSRLQQTEQIVLKARFRLAPGDRDGLLAERERILQARAERHPDLELEPCIGSIFRNIEPTSRAGRRQAAGWFLEQAGAKALRVGGARVYPRHANIIVKGPGCTAQDVRDLADRMRRAVADRFGLVLRREVRYLGRFRGEEQAPRDRFF